VGTDSNREAEPFDERKAGEILGHYKYLALQKMELFICPSVDPFVTFLWFYFRNISKSRGLRTLWVRQNPQPSRSAISELLVHLVASAC
jgi:hypothetical protein